MFKGRLFGQMRRSLSPFVSSSGKGGRTMFKSLLDAGR